MKKKKFKPSSPYSVEIFSLQFFKERGEWGNPNPSTPKFNDDFLCWAKQNYVSLPYEFEVIKVRSYNTGNIGGWTSKYIKCYFLFDDGSSEMFFRINFNLLK